MENETLHPNTVNWQKLSELVQFYPFWEVWPRLEAVRESSVHSSGWRHDIFKRQAAGWLQLIYNFGYNVFCHLPEPNRIISCWCFSSVNGFEHPGLSNLFLYWGKVSQKCQHSNKLASHLSKLSAVSVYVCICRYEANNWTHLQVKTY